MIVSLCFLGIWANTAPQQNMTWLVYPKINIMAEYFHATVVLKEQCQLYNSDELSEESLFNKKVYMVKDRSLQNKQCYC